MRGGRGEQQEKRIVRRRGYSVPAHASIEPGSNTVWAKMRKAGASRFTVRYYGSYGERNFEDEKALNSLGTEVELSDKLYREVVKELEEILDRERPGWNDDESGSGTIEVNVVSGEITFNHAHEVEKVHEETFESGADEVRSRYPSLPGYSDRRRSVEEHFQVLERAGIGRAEADYDGSGDSGSIQEVRLFGPRGGKKSDPNGDLTEAMHDIGYEKLEQHAPGWENNEGSSGTIIAHVKSRMVTIEHRGNYYDNEPDPFTVKL